MVVSCEKPTRVGEDPRVDQSEPDNGEERRGEGEMGDGRWEMGDGGEERRRWIEVSHVGSYKKEIPSPSPPSPPSSFLRFSKRFDLQFFFIIPFPFLLLDSRHWRPSFSFSFFFFFLFFLLLLYTFINPLI